MLPFSAEYLREREPAPAPEVIEKAAPSRTMSRSASAVNLATPPAAQQTLHCAQISDHHCICAVTDTVCDLFVSGFGSITVLKGSVSVNGFVIEPSCGAQHVNCPIWTPAYTLLCKPSEGTTTAKSGLKKHGTDISALVAYLDQHGIASATDDGNNKNSKRPPYKQDLFSEFPTIFAVQGTPQMEQEWLVAAEDQTMYGEETKAVAGNADTVTVYTSPPLLFREASIAKCGSLMVGNFGGMTQNKADCMTLPVSWASASQQVCADYRAHKVVKAVLCGAKGVGKSTCLRYLANTLLSASAGMLDASKSSADAVAGRSDAERIAEYARGSAVCIIDCDLGQPELSVPGSVSLHVVGGADSRPFLSAPHLNMQTPDTSFFLGDVTNKYEPALVLEYVRRLIARYEVIASQVASLQQQHRQAAAKKFVAKNAFNALMLDDSTDDEDEEEQERSASSARGGAHGSALEGAKAAVSPPVPLLVNLDGFVKNMGAEVLESIFAMVGPTHTLHICSDKDRNLLPLEAILGLDGAGTEAAAGLVHAATESAVVECAPRCTLLHLEPGRFYTAPRVAAVDLRTLRLVSYFLRRDASLSSTLMSALRSAGAAVSGKSLSRSSSASKLKNSTSAANLSSHESNPSQTRISPDAVLVRNGALVDPLGLLAVGTVSQAPYSIPFSRLVLGTLPVAGDLSVRLMLAAMNASLVGILIIPAVDECMQNTAGGAASVLCKKRLRHGENEFDLAYTTDIPILPCIGLGIIRAVDIANERILLTTPLDEQLLTAPNTKLLLVKGNGLQVPTALTYSPLLPCFPYMSSESAGEGSAQLRTRNNVKRRAQQQG